MILAKCATVTCLLLTVGGYGYAGSQLAQLYESLSKDPRAVVDVDLFKVVPSEEIPAMISVLNSGNAVAKNAAVHYATIILRIHKMDGENPNFRLLRPPLPQVIREFEVLVPILVAHFDDPLPAAPYLSNGTDDYPEIEWKTNVVQFIDMIGATPSPEMLSWMLKVVQWPNGGRASEAIARADAAKATGPHDAIVRAVKEDAREIAINVAPVLSHLNPMPTSVLNTLMGKIDDVSEPRVAALIIRQLSENSGVGSDLADRLVLKAVDKEVPVEVRVAAIYAVGKRKPSAVSKLAGLQHDGDEKIAQAASDVGVGQTQIPGLNK